MTDFWLIPHPETPTPAGRHVNVQLTQTNGGSVGGKTKLNIFYVIEGPTSSLAVPLPAKPYRTDELWRTTCLEMFVGIGEPEYLEFNFSPSSQWAAYRFSSYRAGMEPLALDSPIIGVGDEGCAMFVSIQLELPTALPISVIGLSAVIEETDGTKSYWALAHAPGPPDFHNPDCFIATLPAPASP